MKRNEAVFSYLESLDKTKGLIDRATNREIVERDLTENTTWVDNKQSSVWMDAGEEREMRMMIIVSDIK